MDDELKKLIDGINSDANDYSDHVEASVILTRLKNKVDEGDFWHKHLLNFSLHNYANMFNEHKNVSQEMILFVLPDDMYDQLELKYGNGRGLVKLDGFVYTAQSIRKMMKTTPPFEIRYVGDENLFVVSASLTNDERKMLTE